MSHHSCSRRQQYDDKEILNGKDVCLIMFMSLSVFLIIVLFTIDSKPTNCKSFNASELIALCNDDM